MRLFKKLAGALRTQDGPHFHSGPRSHPVVCFDASCDAPRLDVGTG